MNLIQYIDFTSLCEDYNLETGDITPMQTFEIEYVLKQFIKQNKQFTDIIQYHLDNNNVSNKQTNNTMKTYLRNIKSIWKIHKQNRFTGNVYSYILKYTFKYIQRSVVL